MSLLLRHNKGEENGVKEKYKKKPIFLNMFWLVCFRWQVNRSWASRGWCSSWNPADPGRFYRKHEGKLPRASFFRYLPTHPISAFNLFERISFFRRLLFFIFIKKTWCSDPAPFCTLRSQQSCKSPLYSRYGVRLEGDTYLFSCQIYVLYSTFSHSNGCATTSWKFPDDRTWSTSYL